MDQKTFSILAGIIFAVVALFLLVRIYMHWPVEIEYQAAEWVTL